MEDLIIVGAGNGDIIKLIEDINSEKPTWNLIGFVEENEKLIGKERFGYPVLGKKEDIFPRYPNVFVSVNVGRNTYVREKAIQNIMKFTDKFATLIHPSVNTRHCEIGVGVTIFGNVILGYNVKIGNFCLIMHGASVNHDSVVGDFSIINPGVLVSGNCKIGKGVLIGTGAMIVQEVEIGNWASIGMGSVVYTNVKDNVTYMMKNDFVEIPKSDRR